MKLVGKIIVYLSIIFFYTNPCEAIDNYHIINAKAFSMGNTLSVLPGFANPASYGFEPSRHLSVQYKNRFGIKDLSTYAGVLNIPNKYLDFGLYVSRYGFDAYNELQMAGNFYRKLTEKISLGIRVNYLSINYSQHESPESVVTGDIGLFLRATDCLYLSVLAVNPLRTELHIANDNIQIPAILIMGMSYEVASSFLVTVEGEKDFVYPFVAKLGLEYTPIKQLSLRTGVSGRPFTPSFGVGINFSSFTVDLGFSKHAILGFNSCCGLYFNF